MANRSVNETVYSANVEVPLPVALSQFVELARARSSRLLRQESLEVVRRYIENQMRAA